MPKISAVIITLNEESNIGECIDSVKNIADEILVVDSFSEDKTEEIAKRIVNSGLFIHCLPLQIQYQIHLLEPSCRSR